MSLPGASWSTAGNWNPVAVPDGAGTAVSITNNIANTSVITVDATSRTIGTLDIGSANNNAAISMNNSSNATLTFDNLANDAAITLVPGSRSVSISVPLLVSSNLRVNANSNHLNGSNPDANLNLGSGSITGNRTIINQGSGFGTVTLSGTLSANMSVLQDSTTSQMFMSVSPQNLFTGGLEVRSGTVRSQNTTGAASGTITLSGGNLLLLRDANITFFSGATTVTADSTMTSGRHSTTGNGTIGNMGTLSMGDQILTINKASNVTGGTAGFNFGTTTLTGSEATFNTVAGTRLSLTAPSGSSALVKIGDGELLLNGASAYNGDTTISGGTLLLGTTGSIANTPQIDVKAGSTFDVSSVSGGFSLANGQTLSGEGTILGGVTASSTSAFSPGSGAAGMLAMNGNLNISVLTSDSLLFDLSTAASDRIDMTGGSGVLSIGSGQIGLSNFAFTDLGVLADGSYTLFSTNNAISGTLNPTDLSGAILGDGVMGTLAIVGNNLVLNVEVPLPAPEPSSMFLIGLGVLGLMRQQRRQRIVRAKM